MDNKNFNQSIPENSQMPPIIPEPRPKKKLLIILGILGAIVVIALAAYFVIPKLGQEAIKKTAQEIYKPAVVLAFKIRNLRGNTG